MFEKSRRSRDSIVWCPQRHPHRSLAGWIAMRRRWTTGRARRFHCVQGAEDELVPLLCSL